MPGGHYTLELWRSRQRGQELEHVLRWRSSRLCNGLQLGGRRGFLGVEGIILASDLGVKEVRV